ncbi:Hsp33 family molecular chaperone HslO [Tumebacillus sp. ITR2]|uniref:33 kDa chaperonin n=1 Tax=Tumebacillus amylolyticus TaxID=2801339 RepID=A0ABS1JFU1_9BACL|nr:Hsp33 family molecular chaperone HslO [Tumebacillus amylolyticus]MBL0389154.1 Hsp33 family molecular chaperone HslO [Tumebacillus amylolyticus]
MSDYIVRATALEGKLRAFACTTTELVRELSNRHGCLALASAALGRTATMGAMMGVMLKGEETVTIQVRGDGPLGKIIVSADADAKVRGYIENPLVELPPREGGAYEDVQKLDVGRGVGEGFLLVTKDLGMKEPYTGSVPLHNGEIAEDFVYYYAQSEQTPTALALGVLVDKGQSVKAAGGFVIQLLPGVADEDITYIEEQLSKFPHITQLLVNGATPEDILQRLIPGEINFLETYPVSFTCDCSRDRFERGLLSLGAAEILSILEEDKGAELVCHFCNEKYQFDEEDLQELLQQAETR